MGCTRRTIHDRCKKYEIVLNPTVSDLALRLAIDKVRHDLPYSGIIFVREELIRKGLKVSRARVAEMLRELDPQATSDRWARAIVRRVYRVPCPMALWHFDGLCLV